MPELSLVQKRALAAALNNKEKADKEYTNAYAAFMATLNSAREATPASEAAERKMLAAYPKWKNTRALLQRLEKKLGVNGRAVNYSIVKRNAIANVLKKHKLAAPLIARAKEKAWLKGLKAEQNRAMANFALISSPSAFRASPVRTRGASPKRKTPSPPRRRTPSPARPANNAHRRIHGIGPENNTRVTWSRNANGKISIHKTLANLNLSLTSAQKNVLNQMSENNAIKTIRELARGRRA
jgi:hypothetical protein